MTALSIRSGLLLALGLLVAAPAAAQPIPTGGTTLYRYAQPGEAVIAVSVWGAVRQPGLYEVRPNADAYLVLSLAGGPVFMAEDAREDRRARLDVSRMQGGERVIVYSVPLGENEGADTLPPLVAGDVLTVRTSVRPRFTWRDSLTVLSVAGTALLVLDRVLDLSN